MTAFAASAVPLPAWLFIALRALWRHRRRADDRHPPVISNVVAPSHRGRANGLAFAGVGTGFVLSGTAVPAFAASGPAPAWLALAAALAVASVVMMTLLPRSAPPVAANRDAPAPAWRRAPALVGLAAAYCGAAAGYVPRTIFFGRSRRARDLGYGLAIGGGSYRVAAGVTAVLAPMLAGLAADRFGYAPVLRVIVGLMAIGAAIPALTHNLVLLTLSAMMAGGLMVGLGSSTSGRTREMVRGRTPIRPPGPSRRWPSPSSRPRRPMASTAILAATGSHRLVFAMAGAIMASGLALEVMTARMRAPVAD